MKMIYIKSNLIRLEEIMEKSHPNQYSAMTRAHIQPSPAISNSCNPDIQ
ncbi:MAG: hypothetical protein I8H71_12105 [Xanthomonadaceae bacterium]|nr:hypothetical protein [Xanthomonadaceae bacterium]